MRKPFPKPLRICWFFFGFAGFLASGTLGAQAGLGGARGGGQGRPKRAAGFRRQKSLNSEASGPAFGSLFGGAKMADHLRVGAGV